MGKVIYLKSAEDDSKSSFLDTYFVTANESGRLKKMWTWLTIIFFLIGSSASIFSQVRRKITELNINNST